MSNDNKQQLRIVGFISRAIHVSILAAIFIGIITIIFVPRIQEKLLLEALEQTDFSIAKSWAARLLASHPSKKTIKLLVQFVNAYYLKDSDGMVPKKDILKSLEIIANEQFGTYEDWYQMTGNLNQWAAKKLGLPLDENGGVCGWYDNSERLKKDIHLIGSKNPFEAWSAWSSFGAGIIMSEGSFVKMAGSTLCDSRPIFFAIKKGAFFDPENTTKLVFEGQPEDIESYRNAVIATTVGEAVALKFWNYSSKKEFPQDFKKWYVEYARKYRLPPLSSCRKP